MKQVDLPVSLNITNGFTGLFSLGHPAFMAVGGYTAAILTFPVQRKAYFLAGLPEWLSRTEVSFLPSLLMGGIMAALAALVLGVPVLRLRGHYLAVATLGVLIIVQVLITNLESVTRGPLGLNGLPALTTLWWVFPWVVVTLIVSSKIKFSSFGRTMLSVREDDLAAECCGVNLFRTVQTTDQTKRDPIIDSVLHKGPSGKSLEGMEVNPEAVRADVLNIRKAIRRMVVHDSCPPAKWET